MTTTPPPTQTPPHASRGVHAAARIRATSNGYLTTVSLLHSDGPFHLRQLRHHGTQARVCVLSAMSAPLGGDRLAIDVTAEAGAELEITTSAATLALRGATTDHATYDVTLTVGEHATLYWLPQPLISTHGSNLRQTCTVDLAPTARLVLREEVILGRAHESPGNLASRLTVHRDGRPLLAQQTTFGPSAPGWDGPAVLAGHRATGHILIVEPAFASTPPAPRLLGDEPANGQGIVAPLAGPALLATALAPTATHLRHLLDDAVRPSHPTRHG
ncbi:urease accessory protein [Kibdelosporangium banguiense]|uniref:Urease accessory protein UreD n=1 Tax=Kibdelosporangium banguiense TaxID=1365924 RepID=A0ABS4TT17_9PSEU|nr:urease accessory protein UreD [Kibdelosporangium banguiense]MBP2327541.1 urease accessory protein [Kibdelosporangium banguiense]